ncbi:unnamed protein product [Heterobilharzia americana]|nr:unnamed protein product [Heterobilharzia americana]
MASNNMYRVGDFVYFESSATAPYQIRRIDELNKTPTGAVEAKVACYYRRRDVSNALINQAEKYYGSDDDYDDECSNETTQSNVISKETSNAPPLGSLNYKNINSNIENYFFHGKLNVYRLLILGANALLHYIMMQNH